MPGDPDRAARLVPFWEAVKAAREACDAYWRAPSPESYGRLDAAEKRSARVARELGVYDYCRPR